MTGQQRVRVAVNGYVVIGKRVADAVAGQQDMTLSGVADIAADWRIAVARRKGYPVFAGTSEAAERMARAGVDPAGILDDLLEIADIVVDCTPKGVASANVSRYRSRGLRFIVQGGGKHALTGHSFSAESNYETAIGRESTKVVSCNTTSVVRTLSALKRAGLLEQARGTLLRRATDPWESHLGGIMNTLVPEPSIPSHQGPDARTVDPDPDVVTRAVKVPETLGHLHYWVVRFTRPRPRSGDELLTSFSTPSAPRSVTPPLRSGGPTKPWAWVCATARVRHDRPRNGTTTRDRSSPRDAPCSMRPARVKRSAVGYRRPCLRGFGGVRRRRP